jgi:hypothetical protein
MGSGLLIGFEKNSHYGGKFPGKCFILPTPSLTDGENEGSEARPKKRDTSWLSKTFRGGLRFGLRSTGELRGNHSPGSGN